MRVLFLRNYFFLALTVLLFARCAGADEQALETYDGPMITFQNLRTLYSESATLKLKLESKLQRIEQDGNVFYPEGITISVYDEIGAKTTVLNADSARFVKEKSLYTAYGSVHVHNLVEEQHLETELLHWNQRKGEIYTEEDVLIRTPHEVVRGRGLTSDESFKNYSIWQARGAFDTAPQAKPAANDPAKQPAVAPPTVGGKPAIQRLQGGKSLQRITPKDK